MPRVLLVVAAFLTLAAPALAGPFDPGARVWTIAGSGTERPRDGAAADAVHVGVVTDLAALPDGSVVIAQSGSFYGDAPLRVDLAGRVQVLRGGPSHAQLAAAPDGTLYAGLGDELRRWDASARRWPLVADLGTGDPALQMLSTSDLAAGPDGTVYVLGQAASAEVRLVAIAPGGAKRSATAAPLAFETAPSTIAALPDGRIALGTEGGTRVLHPDGTVADLVPRMTGARALAATPAGDLVRTSGGVLQRWTTGGALGVVGAGAGSRTDGDLASRASFQTGPIAVAPDGTVFVSGDDGRVRAVAGGDATTRAFAAVTGRTYTGVRRRRVAVASSTGGAATVVVRTGGRTVRASATIAPGATTVTLPRAPAAGETDVTVTVAAADGRRATASLRVLTWRTLPLKVGLRIAQSVTNRRADDCDDGSCWYDRARDCRRVTALRVTCRRVRSDIGVKPRCLGSVSVVARPEGYTTRKQAGGCRRRR